MSANNKDSKLIFEAYNKKHQVVQEVAPAVAAGGAMLGRAALPAIGRGLAAAGSKVAQAARNFRSGVRNPAMTNLPSGQNAATRTGAAIARNPGTVATAAGTAGYMAATPSPQSTSATSVSPRGEEQGGTLSTTGDGSGAPASDNMAITPTTNAANTDTADSSADTDTSTETTAQGPITDEEKSIFKRLHGTDFSPGRTNDAKLAQMRSASQAAGGYDDIEKVRNAAYAQQYGDTPQGQAYAQRAQQMGVTVPKPGEIKTPEAPAAETQVADAEVANEAEPTTSQDIIKLAQQLGLSQSTIEALSKDPALQS